MGGWTRYKRLSLYAIHLIFYFLLRCVQFIYWNLNGVQNHINNFKKGENYESSAQLLKVWSWSEGRLVHANYQRNFLSTHIRFVHPEYALQKHITLMTVTDKEAIFSIPSPEEDVLDVRKWPFLIPAQAPTTKYILIMPISSFIRLADTLGDPSAKVIWINFTGRCGSTAVMQAFNSLPDVVAISEPMCMTSLNLTFKQKYFGKWEYDWSNSKEYLDMYRSVVRLLLKPYLKEATTIVIKPHIRTTTMDIHFIPKLFPKFHTLFMYRDVYKQVTSMYRAIGYFDPHPEFTFQVATNPFLSRILPNMKPMHLVHFCCNDPEHLQWLFCKDNIIRSTEFVSFAIHYAEACSHFRQAASNGGKPIPAFKFEHFHSNQTKFLQTIFDHVGLEFTEERQKLIQDALKEDSQKGTIIAGDQLRHKKINVTASMIEDVNWYLKYYGLPEWGESLTLPNTVSSY